MLYDTEIQTTISLHGYRIWVCYTVSPEWAVSWWLNPGIYAGAGDEFFESLLRWHEGNQISEKLLSEFEARQYEYEQKITAQVEAEDIPF